MQPRQIYSFALASRLGWTGPADEAVRLGLDFFLDKHRRPDGLFRASVETDGQPRDDRAFLYDQAFALLGFYGAHDIAPRETLREAAAALLERIIGHFKHPGGGFREDDDAPFQSNAQMHLFEACIAWSGVIGGRFTEIADELGALCLERLIDGAHGVLDEFYDADWRPGGPGGQRRIEPGHQYEWAWLLGQWRGSGAERATPHIERLFAIAEAGVLRRLNVAPAALSVDGRVSDPLARLWPQTERLRTAVFLASRTEDGAARARYQKVAVSAADAVLAYLQTPVPGLWRDKMTSEGGFVEEPAPASTLYHIVGSVAALRLLAPQQPPIAALAPS